MQAGCREHRNLAWGLNLIRLGKFNAKDYALAGASPTKFTEADYLSPALMVGQRSA
jgi:hypothetical protein